MRIKSLRIWRKRSCWTTKISVCSSYTSYRMVIEDLVYSTNLTGTTFIVRFVLFFSTSYYPLLFMEKNGLDILLKTLCVSLKKKNHRGFMQHKSAYIMTKFSFLCELPGQERSRKTNPCSSKKLEVVYLE